MRIGMGLDGGGTKTDCVLIADSGRILGRGRGGPSNSSRIGVEAAANGVREAATDALQNAKIAMAQVTSVCAGLAGVALAERFNAMTARLRVFFGAAQFELCTDLDLALAAAGPPPAIVLVAGTGSAAIGVDVSGHVARSGGHGPKQSDEGSAFAIGKRAIIDLAAVPSDKSSDLRARMLEQLGLPSLESALGLDGAEADSVYPRVFPVVANAADEGDEFSQTLLRDAAQSLAGFVADVQVQLNLAGRAEFTLGKTGGMIGRSQYLDAQLDAALRTIAPHAKLQTLQTPLAEVAARKALGL